MQNGARRLGDSSSFFYLIVLVFVSIMVIFPFIFSFTAGLHNSIDVVKPGIHLWPAKPLWDNYLDAWQRFKMSRLFLNTSNCGRWRCSGAVDSFIPGGLQPFQTQPHWQELHSRASS